MVKKKKQEEMAYILKSIPKYDKAVNIILNTDWFSVCHEYGIFEIFTQEYIKELSNFIEKRFGKNIKIVEVCAGDGRLTKVLKEKGFNIIGIDDRSRQKDEKGKTKEKQDIKYPDFIINQEALQYIKDIKPELIIASWIEYGSDLDIKIVETGIPLIIIGEGHGGCTGTFEFWNRDEFKYEKLDKATKYNIARTDGGFMGLSKHTSTYLVRLK